VSSTGRLLINLDSLVSNWLKLSSRLNGFNSQAHCAAVVKANAYGLGVAPIALALRQAGCQHLFVASLDEAVELRELLGDDEQFIYVLSGLAHGCGSEWLAHNLIPVLSDYAHCDLWYQYCQRAEKALPCVIKVDTGMHRLGLNVKELSSFLDKRVYAGQMGVRMLMSHLACADDKAHSLNRKQLEVFSSALSEIKSYYPQALASLANSSGIFLGEQFHFDMARPGSALYGVNPTPGEVNPMSPVVELSLPVIQLRTLSVGETVGYGATFEVTRETRVATVFGGYADGLLRCLSNVGYGYCNGIKVPIVGRVSMDSMAFDVTDLDFDPDYIHVLNDIQGVDELAAYANTIGYEVLTSLGTRYKRQYIGS
jgi:alanine racemase